MERFNLRVLFRYRLLVQTGYLDDDVVGDDAAWNHPASFRILVHDDLCIGCYACREECPASAIHVWDGCAHVTNPLECVACSDTPCVAICPTVALEDRRPGTLRFS